MWINPLEVANYKIFSLEKELVNIFRWFVKKHSKDKSKGISISIENSCRGIAIDTRSTKYI